MSIILEQAVHDAMAGALARANARIVRQASIIAGLIAALERAETGLQDWSVAEWGEDYNDPDTNIILAEARQLQAESGYGRQDQVDRLQSEAD